MADFREWLIDVVATTTAVFRDNDREAPPNRCVEWARVQTLVFDALGVKARAVPVDVMAGGLDAADQLLYNRPMTPEQLEAGVWTVGVSHRQNGSPTGWDGHMVVVVTKPGGGRILIDGTADQLSRPQRGFVVPPIVILDLPPIWAEPVFTDPERHTGIVRYTPMPPQAAPAKQWQGSTAWNNPVLPQFAATVAGWKTPWVDVAQ